MLGLRRLVAALASASLLTIGLAGAGVGPAPTVAGAAFAIEMLVNELSSVESPAAGWGGVEPQRQQFVSDHRGVGQYERDRCELIS